MGLNRGLKGQTQKLHYCAAHLFFHVLGIYFFYTHMCCGPSVSGKIKRQNLWRRWNKTPVFAKGKRTPYHRAI
jgi:hypothetical protein